MDPISSGLLNTQYFVAEVIRELNNVTGGLRNYTNNQGIITGNQVRWSVADIDAIASEVNAGSPIVGRELLADTATATLAEYDDAVFLHGFNLNSTNSAPSLRALAAKSVARSLENRFTDLLLTEMMNYDDVDMELGSSTESFDVDVFIDLNRKADDANWGYNNRFLLLPPVAKQTLLQDEDFKKTWNEFNGAQVISSYESMQDNEESIRFVNFRGFNVGFMGVKGGQNKTGLPIASDTSVMGFAWKPQFVGFARNSDLTVDVSERKDLRGMPMQFYSKGTAGVKMISTSGVIGIKLANN